MASNGNSLLRIYLTDHLTAARGGIDLTERCLSQNDEGELGIFLRLFLAEIRDEREALKKFLESLGGSPSLLKETAVRIAQKALSLKLNGRLFGYSDLSRLVELESILAGARAKLDLWLILKRDRKIAADFPVKSLIERAERQIADLQKFCLQAAAQAFGSRQKEIKKATPLKVAKKQNPDLFRDRGLI